MRSKVRRRFLVLTGRQYFMQIMYFIVSTSLLKKIGNNYDQKLVQPFLERRDMKVSIPRDDYKYRYEIYSLNDFFYQSHLFCGITEETQEASKRSKPKIDA